MRAAMGEPDSPAMCVIARPVCSDDSATLAELLCVLSAIASVPLRQDIAVTGSDNQRGQVQAIGAANERVEGFFDICRLLGLPSQQGVCLPYANLRHLVLRDDVNAAIAAGQFHIGPVASVDDAIELFTGLPAGAIAQADTFHSRVARRLQEMSAALKKRYHAEHVTTVTDQTPSDPRPPLPGRP